MTGASLTLHINKYTNDNISLCQKYIYVMHLLKDNFGLVVSDNGDLLCQRLMVLVIVHGVQVWCLHLLAVAFAVQPPSGHVINI